MKYFLIILLIFFSILTLITSVPTDLTCKGVSLRSAINLDDCYFINSTDINCDLFSKAIANSSVTPVQFTMSFKTVFYLKEKIYAKFDDDPVPKWWWCLGIRSSTLRRVDDLPANATNILVLPSLAATLLNVMSKGTNCFVEFYGTAAAGFVLLRDDCQPGDQILDPSCILTLKGANYVILPGEGDFTPWDIIFGKILTLYFKTMRGILKYLTMSTNLSGSFASTWLKQLTYVNVVNLNISNNNFNSDQGILPHRFENLIYLKTLYMQNCQLNGIDPANFKETPNLEHLDLSDNMFNEPPAGLTYLTKLKSLKIGVDRTKHVISNFTLCKGIFNLTSLRNLTLAGLPLITIKKNCLPNSLENLDVSNCDLSYLSYDTFDDIRNLKLLNLQSNYLRTIHPYTFQNIKSNSIIILSYNDIRNGQKLKLNNVTLLDISNNRIQNPTNIISTGYIKKLDLSYNSIVNWSSIDLFNNNNYTILELNISYNDILIINNDMIPSLNTIKLIDLGGNLINCQDCNLKYTKKWLNNTNTTIYINGFKNTLKCFLPINEKNKLVKDAFYDKKICEMDPINLLLVAILPAGIIFTLASVTMLLFYMYRFEIMYIKHLYRIKRRNESVSERDGCKYDVFVSYCGKDRDWVIDILLPALENPDDRYSLCLHERDFMLGTYIIDNIVSCIDKSRRVILVLTNNYIKSQWCQWELQMAQHRIFEDYQDFLVLLELEQVEREQVPLHLRTLMATRTYLEWPRDNLSVPNLRIFWARLKEALGTSLAISNLHDGVINDSVPDLNCDSDLESDDELLHFHLPCDT